MRLILGFGTPPSPLLLLLVKDPLALLDQLEGHRNAGAWREGVSLGALGVVERADEVDTLDASPLGMLIVPADKLTLVGVGLLLDSVVDDQYAILAFDLTRQWLEQAPQGTGVHLLRSEEAGDLLVTHLSGAHPREAGSGGVA